MSGFQFKTSYSPIKFQEIYPNAVHGTLMAVECFMIGEKEIEEGAYFYRLNGRSWHEFTSQKDVDDSLEHNGIFAYDHYRNRGAFMIYQGKKYRTELLRYEEANRKELSIVHHNFIRTSVVHGFIVITNVIHIIIVHVSVQTHSLTRLLNQMSFKHKMFMRFDLNEQIFFDSHRIEVERIRMVTDYIRQIQCTSRLHITPSS